MLCRNLSIYRKASQFHFFFLFTVSYPGNISSNPAPHTGSAFQILI